jgi:hypothetical protein
MYIYDCYPIGTLLRVQLTSPQAIRRDNRRDNHQWSRRHNPLRSRRFNQQLGHHRNHRCSRSAIHPHNLRASLPLIRQNSLLLVHLVSRQSSRLPAHQNSHRDSQPANRRNSHSCVRLVSHRASLRVSPVSLLCHSQLRILLQCQQRRRHRSPLHQLSLGPPLRRACREAGRPRSQHSCPLGLPLRIPLAALRLISEVSDTDIAKRYVSLCDRSVNIPSYLFINLALLAA